MSEDKRIDIISDLDGVIEFDDVTIIHDRINREEVASVKQEIESLEQQKLDIDARLLGLRAKLDYATKVIELADAKRQNENQEVNI